LNNHHSSWWIYGYDIGGIRVVVIQAIEISDVNVSILCHKHISDVESGGKRSLSFFFELIRTVRDMHKVELIILTFSESSRNDERAMKRPPGEREATSATTV
jgi:hypothetical protein